MKNKKYVVRIAAGAVMVAMLGTGAGAYNVYAEKDVKTEKDIKTGQEEKLIKTLSKETEENKDAGKEETVYVIAKADGTPDSVIVSEWLKNKEGSSTLQDVSDLEDITNIKGDETFTQKGNKITWKAQGNDIYYQGTTKKELPVQEKITYYLDGQEMEPEEMAGKSGKATIRFDYTNNAKTTETVEGETYEVYVPFTVMTGMILPEDFSNVEVTNGKVISDGSKKVVVGIAMPGLTDSLNMKEEDLDEDVNIPDYVEVTADVEHFSLDMSMSVVMSELIGDSDLEGTFDLTGLEEGIDKMSDSSKQLVKGSTDLAEGLDTLKSSMSTFAAGADTLKSGITNYTNGASDISQGAETLSSGIGALSEGVSSLTNALGTAMSDSEKQQVAEQADAAVDTAFAEGTSASIASQASQQFKNTMTSDETVGAIYQGMRDSELYTGLYDAACAQKIQEIMAAAQVDQAAAQAMFAADNGPGQVQMAVEQKLQTLAASVAAGIAENGKTAMGTSVADACKTAAKTAAETAAVSGAEGAKSKIAEQLQQSGMADGILALKDGADKLAQGSASLVANNNTLTDGADKISKGASQLTGGVNKLEGGSNQLMEGMVKFDEEGVQKLADSYHGDVKELLNKLTAVTKAGKNYQTFTKLADQTQGTVKFILRTEAVKEEK